MALIALTTAGRVEVENSVLQQTKIASVEITAGHAIKEDVNGKWAIANATDAANSTGVFIATRHARAGDACTGIRIGEMSGWDLSGLAYNTPVYLSDTAGRLADAAGTVSVVVARVTSARAVPLGTAPSKLLRIQAPL